MLHIPNIRKILISLGIFDSQDYKYSTESRALMGNWLMAPIYFKVAQSFVLHQYHHLIQIWKLLVCNIMRPGHMNKKKTFILNKLARLVRLS